MEIKRYIPITSEDRTIALALFDLEVFSKQFPTLSKRHTAAIIDGERGKQSGWDREGFYHTEVVISTVGLPLDMSIPPIPIQLSILIEQHPYTRSHTKIKWLIEASAWGESQEGHWPAYPTLQAPPLDPEFWREM
ncbi:MAG: hypothetical protein J2P36_04980 [Ktedonobacteraceae bacterium]|nr:hypothetical protein [Ktedonobacteraceae bacterium]